MSEEVKRAPMVPAWKIWANPIVRRYARSRLRVSSFSVFLLLVVMIAGFIFFASRLGTSNLLDFQKVDAARIPIFPLLVMQGIILFMLGTGQVAGSMTAEADEGVLDYQRLAPMTPMAKVLGYLFGLPIREWILFAATLPFSIWSMIEGQVPIKYLFQIYAVFIMAGILYHLTGLLAGTVMKNRRWAFLSSMGLVFILYTIIPQAAKFGLVYFKYLTIYPVIEEAYPFLIERRLGNLAEIYQTIVPDARFFGINLPQFVFTLLSQSVLALAIGTMLWRRWRKNDCHLLGKLGAVGLFGWLQIVLLGNALPLIANGDIFPSRELNRRFGMLLDRENTGWQPLVGEALAMIALFGFVTLTTLWMMTYLITPTSDDQIRGWRRARKLGNDRLPFRSDPATSTPWVFAMAAMGVAGWFTFSSSLMNARWFITTELSEWALLAMALSLFGGGLAMQALLETKGKKVAGLAAIFVGVLPLMLGVIFGVSDESLVPASVWVVGICPASWPVYAAGVAVPVDDMPRDLMRSLPKVFWFWQGVAVLTVGWLLLKLREARKQISEASKN